MVSSGYGYQQDSVLTDYIFWKTVQVTLAFERNMLFTWRKKKEKRKDSRQTNQTVCNIYKFQAAYLDSQWPLTYPSLHLMKDTARLKIQDTEEAADCDVEGKNEMSKVAKG